MLIYCMHRFEVGTNLEPGIAYLLFTHSGALQSYISCSGNNLEFHILAMIPECVHKILISSQN